MPVYRRSIMCPECKVMHKKLPEHLRVVHKYTPEQAKLRAKEERAKLNNANKEHHVVSVNWVRNFAGELPMTTARICEMLRALGHVVVGEVSTYLYCYIFFLNQ